MIWPLKLTRLEHALGIGYKKLNIDDARNVARCKIIIHISSFIACSKLYCSVLISIHRYVDKQRAMFLPTPEMVDRISHNHEIGHDIRNVGWRMISFLSLLWNFPNRYTKQGKFLSIDSCRFPETQPRTSSTTSELTRANSLRLRHPWLPRYYIRIHSMTYLRSTLT